MGPRMRKKLENGIVTIFVSGSTAVTTIEFEPGLRSDFPIMLNRIVPKDIEYKHDETWHDGNGHSHVRAPLIGPSLTVPFKDRNLILGTWQQIVFIELDIRSRERRITLQIVNAMLLQHRKNSTIKRVTAAEVSYVINQLKAVGVSIP
jgi:secondary thiamine-phosphate synthase enzyme